MLSWIANQKFRFASKFDIKVSDQARASNALRLKPDDTTSNDIAAVFEREYAKRNAGDIFSFDLPYTSPKKGRQYTQPVFVLINRHSYSNAVYVDDPVLTQAFEIIKKNTQESK